MSDAAQTIDMDEVRETCPVFRILIIGRANAGKTTILQKVCNVSKDTKPVVYDADGNEIKPGHGSKFSSLRNRLLPSSWMRKRRAAQPSGSESDSDRNDTDILRSSTQRGRHDITNQITYPGSRFIFHDSRGIEAGSLDEFQIIHTFIRERASKPSLDKQLHAIWFCVSMDNTRPLVEAELALFNKDTANAVCLCAAE